MWLQADSGCHRQHQELMQHHRQMYRAQVHLRQIPPCNVNSSERPLHLLAPAAAVGASSEHLASRRRDAPADSEDGLRRFPGQRKVNAPRTKVRADASWIQSLRQDNDDPNHGCDGDILQLPASSTSPPLPPRPIRHPQHPKLFVRPQQPPPLPPPPPMTREDLLIQRSDVSAAALGNSVSRKKVIDWQLKHICQRTGAAPHQSPPERLLHPQRPLKQPLRRANNWAEGLDRIGGGCGNQKQGWCDGGQLLNSKASQAGAERRCNKDARDEEPQFSVNTNNISPDASPPAIGRASSSQRHHLAGPDDQTLQNFRRVQHELQARQGATRQRSDAGTADAVAAGGTPCQDDREGKAAPSNSSMHREGHRRHLGSARNPREPSNLSLGELHRLERQLDDLRTDSRLAQRRLERRLSDCRQQAELANSTATAAALAANTSERKKCACWRRRMQRFQPNQEARRSSAETTEAALLERARRELRRSRRQRREALARESRSLERQCDWLRLRLGEFSRRLAADSCDEDATIVSDSDADQLTASTEILILIQ